MRALLKQRRILSDNSDIVNLMCRNLTSGKGEAMEDELFNSLVWDGWNIAFRTYGNNHNTLIGLVVNWWITHAPQMGTRGEHWAIESGILYQKGQNGEACDAILVEGQFPKGIPKGIVEVELGVNDSKKGQKVLDKYFSTMDKIGEYFKSSEYDFSSSQFGLFFAYSEDLKEATRNNRLEQLVEHGIKLSQDFPQQQQLFILWLDKTHEVPKLGRWDLKSQCGWSPASCSLCSRVGKRDHTPAVPLKHGDPNSL